MFLAHGGTGKETERSDLFRSVRQVGFRADKGPRDRKGVAFCFIMQLLAETCFWVEDRSTCLQGELNMNLFGCRQTSWLKGC